MLLEARDVTKAFGSFKAVDAASVALEQGDILGLIGPNGAGKSTLFNCLTGDLLATSGRTSPIYHRKRARNWASLGHSRCRKRLRPCRCWRT